MNNIANNSQLFNARRFDLGIYFSGHTFKQIQTTYLVTMRLLYLLKANHGSLLGAKQAGEEQKVIVALAMQSRAATHKKTYDGGLQGFIRGLKSALCPNGSKRMIQAAIASIEDCGAIVKHSHGSGNVPTYDVVIEDLLLIAEMCESRIISELGFDAIPEKFHWIAREFESVIGESMNRLQDGVKPTVEHEFFEQDLTEYRSTFKPVTFNAEVIADVYRDVLRRFCGIGRSRQPLCEYAFLVSDYWLDIGDDCEDDLTQ